MIRSQHCSNNGGTISETRLTVHNPTYYTVFQKNIPNIFDCNLKTNCQILIIFGTFIPDTTCHRMTIQFPTSSSICFCTTWGKHNQRNITFYPMWHDCLINITRKNILFTCLTLWLTFHPVGHFLTACSKTARSVGKLCEQRQGDASDNSGCTSRFLTSQIFLNFIW